MNKKMNEIVKSLIQLYVNNEEAQIRFPEKIILIFRIHQSFLGLSYLFENKTNSYFRIISMFARPQLFLPKNEAFQFIIFFCCLFYIANKFKPLWLSSQIKIFGLLINSGLLNFFFEYSLGQFQIITHTALLLISIIESIILSETLNAETINFQNTRITIYDFFFQIFNYVIMILYTYQLGNQVIKLFAIIMVMLRILKQIQYSPNKALVTKSILMSIYCFTLLIALIQQIFDQNPFNFEFILIPVIYKLIYMILQNKFKKIIHCTNDKQFLMFNILHYLHDIKDLKQLYILRPQSSKDKIIYCSLLMLQENNYLAYKQLMTISQKDLNLLEQFKMQVILRQCLNKIKRNIEIKQMIEQKSALLIQNLMISEQQNQAVLNDILEILKEKQLKQTFLLKSQNYNHFKQYFSLVEKILVLKQQLENYYFQFASLKTQSILGFFYVEVINDYLAANFLFSEMQQKDDKIKRINRNQEQLTSKMSFIITTLDQDLIIQRVSTYAPKILGLSQEFLKDKLVDILIPPGIAEIHNELVIQFLKIGESKYMRNFEEIFLFRQKENRMIDIRFAFDINFMNGFTFISFIQKAERKSISLVLDSKNIITCLSESLISRLQPQFQITKYIGLDIMTIIQEFSPTNQNLQTVENATLFLEKFNLLDHQNSILSTNYTINTRCQNNKVLYRIITFDFFKNICEYQFSNSLYSIQQYVEKNLVSIEDVNQESKINIPYMDPSNKKIEISFGNKRNIERYESNVNLGYTTLNDVMMQQNEQNLCLSSPKNDKIFLIHDKIFENQIYQSKIQKDLSQYKNLDGDILEDENISDQQSSQKKILFQEDQSSQLSSLMGIKSSPFYKKYKVIEKILDISIFSDKIRTYILLLICCIISQFIIQVTQLVSINLNFSNLISDIDLLQINNFVFQPLETFIVTRYTIVIYRQQKDAQIITLQKFNELVKFPLQNIGISYDQLQKNLKYLTYQSGLQKFLDTNNYNIYLYQSSGIGEKYNMTLRNCFEILKNHEYTIKMGYQMDGIVYADTPYAYFQYKNYLPMKKLFNQLNDQILIESIERSQKLNDQIVVLFSISCGILMIFLFAIFYSNYLINKKQLKFLQLMLYVQQSHVYYDQSRLIHLIQKIEIDYNILCRYKFNLTEKEKILETKIEILPQPKRIKLKGWNTFNLHFNFIVIFCIILILGNSTITFYEGKYYLARYPETAQFYKELSDVGTDVPTLFAQREVLFGRKELNLYTEEECQDLINIIKFSLNRISAFLNKSIDYEKYIITSQFKYYFEIILSSNLCNFIPDQFQLMSQEYCEKAMQQNLKRGLKVILTYMISFISTDMEINNFTYRVGQNNFELEGAFLVSNIISSVNAYFNKDLQRQTELNNLYINIHNILVIILLFMAIFFISTTLKKQIQFRLGIVQCLIYILPVKTLYLDKYFERKIRHLSKVYK